MKLGKTKYNSESELALYVLTLPGVLLSLELKYFTIKPTNHDGIHTFEQLFRQSAWMNVLL